MHLTAKRPPSTAGCTASITARALPSGTANAAPAVAATLASAAAAFSPLLFLRFVLVTGLGSEHDRRQRRQIEIDRLETALGGNGHRLHTAQVAPPGAAVLPRIGIQDLAPYAPGRHADQEIGPRHRCEVAYHEQWCAVARRLA